MTLYFLKYIEYIAKVVRFFFISNYTYKAKKHNELFGYIPDIDNPQSFNEKILHRMIYRNDPIYTLMADKVTAREYAKELIGEKYLIPIYGVYTSSSELSPEQLPGQFVLKCSHDSGSVMIFNELESVNWKIIRLHFAIALSKNMYYVTREKHYKNIKPVIICEQLLDIGGNQKNETHYEMFRLHCFHGELRCIEIDYMTPSGVEHVNLYDSEWSLLNVHVNNYPALPDAPLPNTEIRSELVYLARKLVSCIDYCRVDFYVVNDAIYFSEFTMTPYAGKMKFSKIEFDYRLGSYW